MASWLLLLFGGLGVITLDCRKGFRKVFGKIFDCMEWDCTQAVACSMDGANVEV